MSETDDTDVLLLIPPDFFLVRSSGSEDSLLESSRTVVHKPQSCTAQVIGKLVSQVQTLESRLESLEISTTITDSSFCSLPRKKIWDSDSVDSKSVDNKYFTFPRRRKKVRKHRNLELSLTSLDSVSTRRGIPRLKLKEFDLPSIDSKAETINDTPSMDGDISSIVSTPNKKNDKLLLNEIDEFLTKVEAFETPDSKYKDVESSVSPENVIKATGDYLSQKHGKSDEVRLPSGRVVSSAVLDKYIYLVKSNPTSATHIDKQLPSTSEYKTQNNEEPIIKPQTSYQTVAESQKVYDTSRNLADVKSPSARRLNFAEKDVQPTSTPKKPTSYLDSFKPSSNKIYDRASKVLEQYKLQNCSRTQNTQSCTSDSYLSKDEFKLPQMRPFVFENKDGNTKNKFLESIDTELLSLSDLWGEKADKSDKGESIKLEEERLKREHCEALIQQLQKKILEQQEKLAVAIRVDRAKDNAINRLKDAWMKLTGNLDKAEERHRSALDKMLKEVDNFKQIACESQKKTSHFETELYKALDLAHDYQEKSKLLSNQVKEAKDEMEKTIAAKDDVIARKDNEIEVLKDNYETVMRLNKQSTDCVRNLEEALGKEKIDHEQTKSKVNELNRMLQSRNDETSILCKERDVLKDKVNEERSRNHVLETQIGNQRKENADLIEKCTNLETEVKTLRKHLELQKNELKTHYQKQLEDAVLAKLQEFQQQLDLAEREMDNDARVKENAIVDTYTKQIARIEEQHKLEVNLLEEKQREEIKLCRLQLAQSSEKISLLEQKLESYRRRRGQIASQLHGVMEAQWRQALLILTHGNAGGNPSLSSADVTRADSVCTPLAQDPSPPQLGSTAGFAHPVQQPHAHRQMFNFDGLSDNELQQYVKLLLTKPPSQANMDTSEDRHRQDLYEEPTSDRADKDRKPKKSLTTNKPPWKA